MERSLLAFPYRGTAARGTASWYATNDALGEEENGNCLIKLRCAALCRNPPVKMGGGAITSNKQSREGVGE